MWDLVHTSDTFDFVLCVCVVWVLLPSAMVLLLQTSSLQRRSSGLSELEQLSVRPPGSVFSVSKCPSYAVLCGTRLLAVLNVTGLNSGATTLTCLTGAATLDH